MNGNNNRTHGMTAELPVVRAKSREELQRELTELWVASKQQQQPAAPAASNGGNSHHCDTLTSQQQQQHQAQSSPLPDLSSRLSSLLPWGNNNNAEKRKASTERAPSSEVISSELAASVKGVGAAGGAGGVGGASKQHDGSATAGPLWSMRPAQSAKSDQSRHHHSSREGEGSGGCCRWLPFKAIAATLRHNPSIWITTLLVFLLLSTGGLLGVFFISANETYQRRQAAEGFALNAAAAFERQLNTMFFPLVSLATIVHYQPSYPLFNKTFDTVAKQLMEQMPTGITTLIAAPQGVLRNFYPNDNYCQDHCDNVHINLLKDAERRDVALKTIKEGRLVMQGPMMLSQGYFGVVGRLPIFINNSTRGETFGAPDGLAYNCSVCFNEITKTQFWGFVNVVVNLAQLVDGSDSRLKDLRVSGYFYELFKYEKNGTRKQIGHTMPLPQDPVQADVHVPGGEWLLELSPDKGWVPMWRAPIMAVVVLLCFLVACLLGAMLISNKLQAWLKAANEALATEKERMDVLLARQHNLISCVLQGGEGADSTSGKDGSMQQRTLARIEDMRREIGVAQHTNGTTSGADELQLIELIDEGTYGKVYKGLWRGSTVAVKTMVLPAKMSGAEKRERMAIMEAAISSSMTHPNIVQTYTYVIKPCSTTVPHRGSSESESSQTAGDNNLPLPSGSLQGHLASPEASSATVHNFEVSLVLEFCDWGSLRTALDAGAFFAEDNSLNYAAILDTAADVARAMLHLHKNQVLHSDLKVRNVLLKSDSSGRGCVAKVADFGLAVKMDCMETHISDAFQGTMSHLSPEGLVSGHLSKASDVYAYGITLWELYTGGSAYQGIPRALVGHQVAVLGLRPTLPPFTPPDFKLLIQDCWHQDPLQRPTFDTILERLVKMRGDLGTSVTPPLQRYKLRPKLSQEGRGSSEKDAGAAADARAQGLMHLGSYYVNVHSTNSTMPGAYGGSGSGSHPPLSDNGSCGGSGSGSGSSSSVRRSLEGRRSLENRRSLEKQQQPAALVSYRPAPRTPYMVSRLYGGSTLDAIPDDEHEHHHEEQQQQQQGAPATQPDSAQQQQQQQQQPQPPQEKQCAGGLAHSAAGTRQQPPLRNGTTTTSSSSSSSSCSRSVSIDMAAPDDGPAWPASAVGASTKQQQQQQQQQQNVVCGGRGLGSSNGQQHPQQCMKPDIEQGSTC